MINIGRLYMPVIRPVSDLRNNFSSISETVHSDDEPVFLTKNGVGDMVVMSIEHYEKQLARIELYQKLNEASDEIRNGAVGKDAREVLKGLMDK
jgi:prevent-host-death family protein